MDPSKETPQTLPYKCKPCLGVGLNFCKFWQTGFNCEDAAKPSEEKLPAKTFKLVQVYGFNANPGRVTLLEFKPAPNQKYEARKYTFKRNPNKVNLIVTHKPPNRAVLYTYKDNREKVWLSLNQEFIPFNREDAKAWYLAFREALKRLKTSGTA